MSIRKRIFLQFGCTIFIILVLSSAFLYSSFTSSMSDQILQQQESTVTLNRNLLIEFLDSIRQISYYVISDDAIGQYMSATQDTLQDPVSMLNTRASLNRQFSHYALAQAPDKINIFRSTLFLNSDLPLAEYYEDYTLETNPYVQVCNIFSDANVRDMDWYKTTLDSVPASTVFINEATDEFCFAQKITNNNYRGPYLKNGNGVVVVSVKNTALEQILAFRPITQSSCYALLGANDTPLYMSANSVESSLYTDIYTLCQEQGIKKEGTVKLDGGTYIVSIDSVKYGLRLIFLTPYSDIQDRASSLLFPLWIFTTIVCLGTLFFIYLLSDQISRPIIRLSHMISQIHDTRNFDPGSLHSGSIKELLLLQDSFGKLIHHNNQLITDIQEKNELQKQTQLRALQAQINPHFIYNAMDTVNWMALGKNEDDIANIIDCIAGLMRYSITNPDNMVNIKDELNNIEKYISIHTIRHTCSIQISIQPEIRLEGLYIPKFILQPLVENSICHGMENSQETLHISIRIYSQRPCIMIDVADDGTGFDAAVLNDFLDYKPTDLKVSSGFGIRNVNERIKLRFGDRSGLTYISDENGGPAARLILDYSEFADFQEFFNKEYQ